MTDFWGREPTSGAGDTIAPAALAERERIAAMLEVEADETAKATERIHGRPPSAAGVLRYAAQLVREGATAEDRLSTSD